MNKDTTGYDALEQITTFYHASPTWFETATLLTPQRKKNFGDCSRDFVYLTDAPAPHYSVEQIARERFWHIYQVEPIGRIHPGECDDLICDAATVVAYLGTADMFAGSSKVVFSPSVKPEAHRCYSASSKRRAIAERSLGAWVQIDKDGGLIEGRIIFTDYESLNVLVAGERLDFFASLRDVQVLSLSKEALGVVHDVRLNPWRYGSGWEGCELSSLRRVFTLEVRHKQRPFSFTGNNQCDRTFSRMKDEIGVVLDKLVVEQHQRSNVSFYKVESSTCAFSTLFR